jgi:hypothetical protein
LSRTAHAVRELLGVILVAHVEPFAVRTRDDADRTV